MKIKRTISAGSRRMKFYEGMLVFLVSLFLFSAGSGRSSIYILDESKNAQCAWEMMQSDDYVVPVFNSELRTDKPPLHYYAMMAGYALFGKTAFAARIMSSIAGAILMLIIFLFVRHYSGLSSSFWTIISLLSSIHWVIEFHLAVPDPYLITFIATGLMAFYHFSETFKKWPVIVMYVCFSLGFLTKGPVAIALPGMAIFLYLLLTGNLKWRVIIRMLPLHGILIFLIINLPWYLLVYLRTDGDWFRGFFLDHNINRFAEVKEGHGGVFLITIAYFIMGMLPFIAFIAGIARKTWDNRRSGLVLFSLVVIAIFIIFFSFSRTKLPNYVMPCFPFAAILTGNYFSAALNSNVKKNSNIIAGLWIILIISLLIPSGLSYGVRFEPLLSELSYLGLPLAFMPAGIIIALLQSYRKRYKSSLLTMAGTYMIASVILMLFILPVIDSKNPVQINMDLLKEAGSVKYYRNVNPSFVFNYGLIEQVKDSAEINYHLENPSNILITSQRYINKNQDYFERYNIVFSESDLFDINRTVIIKGGPGRH